MRTPVLRAVRRRLARETSSGLYIPEIDGLRFVAIAAVFLYHLNGYLLAKGGAALVAAAGRSRLDEALNFGNLGVPLFFGISGFILGLPFAMHVRRAGPRVPLRRYYLRRLTRIEPPYVINLAIVSVLLVAVNGAEPGAVMRHLGPSLVYAHGIVFPGEMTYVNPVAWSLEVEVQFYVLAPLLALVFAIRRPAWRRLAIVVLAIACVAGLRVGRTTSLVGFAQYFMAGFLVADWHAARPDGRRSGWFDLLALGAVAVLPLVAADQSRLDVVLPVVVASLLAAAIAGPVTGRCLRAPWVVAIGGMCYTIYLYHFYAISLLGRFTAPQGTSGGYAAVLAWQVLVVGIPALAGCAVMFLATEQPFMRRAWPARLAQALPARLTGRAAMATAAGRG